MPLKQIPVEDRFWSKVRKTPYCWEWQGATRRGYGAIWIGGRKGRHYPAHRVSVEISTGQPVPKDKMVLHKCDNPLCVNPSHLYIGTHLQNMRDMAIRKRAASNSNKRHGKITKPHKTARHEKNGMAKLTMDKAIEIRNIYANGNHSLSDLAKMFIVSKKTIFNIIHYKIWI